MRGHKRLRQHRDQVAGQLHANLFLLIGRERVDDAVDRRGRAGGVQRAEHQVAGFGGGDGGLIVARSRISPTSITSGSCRNARRSASEKLGTSTPISRCTTIALFMLDGNTRSGLPS